MSSMQLRWIGVAILMLNLILAALTRNETVAFVPLLIGMVLIGVALIVVDCRKEEIEYVKKVRESMRSEYGP